MLFGRALRVVDVWGSLMSLFPCFRACPGLVMVTSFLSTRTNRPTHRAVQEGNAIHLSVCSDWSDLNFPLWGYDTLTVTHNIV